MKRTTVLLAFVLTVALIPGSALAQQPKPQAKQAPAAVERDILQLEHDWSTAGQKKDVAFLQKLYADEYLSTDPEGALFNKAEDIAGLAKADMASFKLEDMKVHVYGNTAVVTGLNTLEAKMGGKDVSGPYRFTDVFVKRDGRWQVVATQATRVTKE